MDNLGSEEVERLKQEVLWSVETVGQTDRERKLVGLVANCPLLWQRGVSAPETAVEEALWTKVSQDAGLTGKTVVFIISLEYIYLFKS